MRKSTSVIHQTEKKARRVGHDPVTAIRLSPDMIERIETWGATQSPPLGRSEAIRELLERGLQAPKPKAKKA